MLFAGSLHVDLAELNATALDDFVAGHGERVSVDGGVRRWDLAWLRGDISVALALTLPDSPWRTDLLVVSCAVVVFTIIVQGLTMPPLLRRMYGAKKIE